LRSAGSETRFRAAPITERVASRYVVAKDVRELRLEEIAQRGRELPHLMKSTPTTSWSGVMRGIARMITVAEREDGGV
jgi:hypothetical protein